jgi:hypothetical protein
MLVIEVAMLGLRFECDVAALQVLCWRRDSDADAQLLSISNALYAESHQCKASCAAMWAICGQLVTKPFD